MNCHVVTTTPAIDVSIEFYTKLGFSSSNCGKSTYIHGGKAIIEIEENRKFRAGVKLYKENWDSEKSRIEGSFSILKLEDGDAIELPGGTWIYLLRGTESPTTSVTVSDDNTVLGNYYGLSFETIEIQRSIALWNILGFEISMGSVDTGWVGMSNNDGFSISIMKALSCPHLFFNPSISYFNGVDNMAVISKIREINIPIIEEITVFNDQNIVDNIIIRDPGGLGFFVFSD